MKERNFIHLFPSDAFYNNYLSKYPYITSYLERKNIEKLSNGNKPVIPRIKYIQQPEIIFSQKHDVLLLCDEKYLKDRSSSHNEFIDIKNIAINDRNIIFSKKERKDAFANKVEEIISKFSNGFITIYKHHNRIEIEYCHNYTTHTLIIHRTIYNSIEEILDSIHPDIDAHLIIKREYNHFFPPRFLLSFSTQMNVIKPFHSSEDYNQRVYELFNKGIHIFVPHRLHLRYNYLYPLFIEECEEKEKRLKDTFHELLMMIDGKRVVKENKTLIYKDNYVYKKIQLFMNLVLYQHYPTSLM